MDDNYARLHLAAILAAVVFAVVWIATGGFGTGLAVGP
jgi:uncharacterized membrane protein